MERLPPSFEEARRRRLAMRDALAGLEDAVAAASASATWRVDVGKALARLRASFVDHIESVEGGQGILEDIVQDVPRLSNLVELLGQEHQSIAAQIDTLVEAVPEGEVEALREQALELMRSIVLHRQRGSDLVWDAYATDIGGQGG